MKVVQLPGCWYLDSLPSGEYAGILPLEKQVTTEFGLVPYPMDEPLWLVTTRVPLRRFMGQGHQTAHTYEWTEGQGWDWLPVACGAWPVIYDQHGAPQIAKCAPPTGSQGWRYVAPDGALVTGDSTIALLHGLLEWTDLSLAQDRSLLVGQGHEDGVRVWAAGQERLLHPGACFNIRAKYDPTLDRVSISFYEVASDGLEGWVYWLSLTELQALPVVSPPALQPVPFQFLHPVMVLPFKADGSGLPDLFSLGSYTEGETLPSPLPPGRLLVGHDAPTPWAPSGIRPFDLPLIECYRTPEETLEQSVARWHRQITTLLAQWSGDCGVIPMMYDQFRWGITDILAGLQVLSDLVNRSPRIKVIAPFAYARANGIVKYPELQHALVAMAQAARAAGTPTLIPVGAPAPAPPPPSPPTPKEPPMPNPNLPSLDTWLHVELPQLRAAFMQTHPGTPTPDDWYAFQTYRRYVEPDAWPFDRMLQHELGNDSPAHPPQ